jgi:hypothetical protein
MLLEAPLEGDLPGGCSSACWNCWTPALTEAGDEGVHRRPAEVASQLAHPLVESGYTTEDHQENR